MMLRSLALLEEELEVRRQDILISASKGIEFKWKFVRVRPNDTVGQL